METKLYYQKDNENILIGIFKSKKDAEKYIHSNTDLSIRDKLLIRE